MRQIFLVPSCTKSSTIYHFQVTTKLWFTRVVNYQITQKSGIATCHLQLSKHKKILELYIWRVHRRCCIQSCQAKERRQKKVFGESMYLYEFRLLLSPQNGDLVVRRKLKAYRSSNVSIVCSANEFKEISSVIVKIWRQKRFYCQLSDHSGFGFWRKSTYLRFSHHSKSFTWPIADWFSRIF